MNTDNNKEAHYLSKFEARILPEESNALIGKKHTAGILFLIGYLRHVIECIDSETGENGNAMLTDNVVNTKNLLVRTLANVRSEALGL